MSGVKLDHDKMLTGLKQILEINKILTVLEEAISACWYGRVLRRINSDVISKEID